MRMGGAVPLLPHMPNDVRDNFTIYPVSCTNKTRKVHKGVFRAAINTVARAKPNGALRRSDRT